MFYMVHIEYEFVLVNDVLKKYDQIKEEIKNF